MIKYFTFWNIIILIVGTFALQSCSVSTTNHYYADKKFSFATDIDMAQALEMMKGLMPDSLNQDQDFLKMEKYPRDWKSLYDLQKEDGKITTNQDSIKILKKLFFKGNFDANDFKGFSVKSEPLTKEELAAAGPLMGKESSVMNNSAFEDWDGKILRIDTSKLQMSPEELQGILKGDDKVDSASPEEMSTFLNMMDMDFKNKLVFEKKIKSIKGKHDWIKKTDNNTIEAVFNLKDLMDKDHQFKDKDQFIIIETE